MGILKVKPVQNTNSKSPSYRKWYMRAHMNSTIDINDLAIHIADDSKVERSQVASVNNAIARQIGELLCNGHPIRIPHLGLLKLSSSSEGTATVEEYNAGKHMKGVRLAIVPDSEIKNELRNMRYEKYYDVTKTPIV
ncbi:MAG: HU family DNA-binding protein [Prevotella sp.]|nr:HU family DNA-binding protein [Prevotella sp.]